MLLDPHNRDAVLSPSRHGAELPRAPDLCTAYVLEVTRAPGGRSPPLSYSLPVRFSRFERLHAELLRELPELRATLPPLPAKRGPADRLLQWGGPTAERIEERTKSLDVWVRAAAGLAGVPQSRALGDLIFLGVGAESAMRVAQDRCAAQAATQESQIAELGASLKTADAYARACRQRKDRADVHSSHLSAALDASTRLLGRQRASATVRRVWSAWARVASRAREARAAKAAAVAARALAERDEAVRLAERRADAADARAAADRASLASAVRELGASDEEIARLGDEISASRLALETTVRSHISASRLAAREAAEAMEGAARQTEVAERAALSRLITACRLAAERAALLSTLRDADAALGAAAEELRRLRVVADEAHGTAVAQRETIASERRARAVSGVARAVGAAASETRLLLLLRSQRERLGAQALELAEVRMAAAAVQGRPELEGAWLRPPSPASEASGDWVEREGVAVVVAVAGDEAELRRKMMERCRNDWLGAMAMSI